MSGSTRLFFVAIGIGLRNTWLGAWSIPLGLLSGASILLGQPVCGMVGACAVPTGTKGIPGRWGFDPDDALYSMGPLAWLGWLSPILVGASVGATAVMIITGVRLLRLRRAADRLLSLETRVRA